MAEQRLAQPFRGFNAPVDPDPAFAAALYRELAAELGFATDPGAVRAVEPSASLASRADAPTDVRAHGHRGTRTWRLGWLAAAAALLLVLGGLAVAAAMLLSKPTPQALVERSRAAYLDPPAFTMEFTDPQGQRWTLAADGQGTWRSESPATAPGAYQLYDGTRIGIYEPSLETWGVYPPADWGGPPYPLGNEFAWSRMVPDSDPIAFETVPCDDATWLGREEVAARDTDHIRCAGSDIDYWLDTRTGLVLRMRAGPTARGWEGPMEGIRPVMEAVSFSGDAGGAGLFAWDGPTGAYPADDPPASTLLETGAVAPALTGTTVDGRPFTTAPGEPVAVLFMSRGAGTTTRVAFDAAASAVDGVRSIVVQSSPPGTVAGYLAGHPTTAAVVADPDMALGQAWRINFVMAMVLLDRDGRVVAVRKESMREADIRAQLEALRDGSPVPEPAPLPEITPYPEPSERIEGSSGGLGRWDSPEPWSAPLLGGGTISAADLRGRPAFVWFWMSESVPSTSSLLQFAQLAKAYGDRAAFLVVAMGEPEPGWIQGVVERAGIDVPIAMDWDGAVDTAFRIGTQSTYLLDASGRVADTVDDVPGEAAAGRMLDALP